MVFTCNARPIDLPFNVFDPKTFPQVNKDNSVIAQGSANTAQTAVGVGVFKMPSRQGFVKTHLH